MLPINNHYKKLIGSLRSLTLPDILQTQLLEFDNNAQDIRHKLEAKHLELQSLESVNRKLASHIGKYDGLFARLCIVWHCIENYVMYTGTTPHNAKHIIVHFFVKKPT